MLPANSAAVNRPEKNARGLLHRHPGLEIRGLHGEAGEGGGRKVVEGVGGLAKVLRAGRRLKQTVLQSHNQNQAK